MIDGYWTVTMVDPEIVMVPIQRNIIDNNEPMILNHGHVDVYSELFIKMKREIEELEDSLILQHLYNVKIIK